MHANHAIPSLNTPRREFLSGVKSELPLMVGVIPFGMIYGILAIAAGLPPSVAQAMSFIIFAGSSQFVSAQLYGLGVPAMLNVFTVWVINLRHALYSASVASYLQKLPTRWKLILAYLLTDEAYAVTIIHYQQEGDKRYRHWYFLGAGLTLWTTWQMSTDYGYILGCYYPCQLVSRFHPGINIHCPGCTISQRQSQLGRCAICRSSGHHSLLFTAEDRAAGCFPDRNRSGNVG